MHQPFFVDFTEAGPTHSSWNRRVIRVTGFLLVILITTENLSKQHGSVFNFQQDCTTSLLSVLIFLKAKVGLQYVRERERES